MAPWAFWKLPTSRYRTGRSRNAKTKMKNGRTPRMPRERRRGEAVATTSLAPSSAALRVTCYALLDVSTDRGVPPLGDDLLGRGGLGTGREHRTGDIRELGNRIGRHVPLLEVVKPRRVAVALQPVRLPLV